VECQEWSVDIKRGGGVWFQTKPTQTQTMVLATRKLGSSDVSVSAVCLGEKIRPFLEYPLNRHRRPGKSEQVGPDSRRNDDIWHPVRRGPLAQDPGRICEARGELYRHCGDVRKTRPLQCGRGLTHAAHIMAIAVRYLHRIALADCSPNTATPQVPSSCIQSPLVPWQDGRDYWCAARNTSRPLIAAEISAEKPSIPSDPFSSISQSHPVQQSSEVGFN
jgi:hypothetical protein